MDIVTSQKNPYDHGPHQKDEVYQTLESFSEAICEGDIKHMMSFYSDDIIAYDIRPPLEITGKDKYQNSWFDFFSTFFLFPINYNYEKQKISMEGQIAFTHALVHISGESRDGKRLNIWMRNTTCLRKIEERWLITHEHNSVPMDNEMKALVNLHPENLLH